MKPSVYLLVGGGSGGHLAPLLPIYTALKALQPDAEFHLAVPKADLHSSLLTPFPELILHPVESGKLNRFWTTKHFGQLASLAKGLGEAKRLVKALKPQAVIAKGGFASVPVVLAAVSQGIPVFGHETDAVPGLANRLICRLARKFFVSFPLSFYPSLPQSKLEYVGQPVSEAFFQPSLETKLKLAEPNQGEEEWLDFTQPVITVVSGSQGGRRVNALIHELWPKILPQAQLVHVTGKLEFNSYLAQAQALPSNLRPKLWLRTFVNQLPELYQQSTVLVSRSGGSVFEAAAAGSACILIPLSTSAQNHQCCNAEILAQAGAAILFDEIAGTSEQLLAIIQSLLQDQSARAGLSAAIRPFAQRDAAHQMAKTILASC